MNRGVMDNKVYDPGHVDEEKATGTGVTLLTFWINGDRFSSVFSSAEREKKRENKHKIREK